MVPCRARGMGNRPELLDRAEADPVRLSQGSVDGSRFGNAQLSPMHHVGNVGRVGVAVTDETLRSGRFVDGCLKDPAIVRCITQFRHGVDTNSMAMVFL